LVLKLPKFCLWLAATMLILWIYMQRLERAQLQLAILGLQDATAALQRLEGGNEHSGAADGRLT
jgi:hypothetical protein